MSVLYMYIHENLVRIQPLVHKILCRQESGGGGGGGGGCGHNTFCTVVFKLKSLEHEIKITWTDIL